MYVFLQWRTLLLLLLPLLLLLRRLACVLLRSWCYGCTARTR
jgi:hypothetical protein